jgi:hypothetical protein
MLDQDSGIMISASINNALIKKNNFGYNQALIDLSDLEVQGSSQSFEVNEARYSNIIMV